MLDLTCDYNRLDLINALISHRDKHIEDYKIAMSVYEDDRVKAVLAIENACTEALSVPVDLKISTKTISDLYVKLMKLTEPVNAEKYYNQYISLFSSAVSETLTLGLDHANSILNDEWDWAVTAKFSNALYSSRYKD